MSLRLADILATVPEFLQGKVRPEVAKAFRAILACKTAELGGHVARCEAGHVLGAWYNSCRNRSCPRCSYGRQAKWIVRKLKTVFGCTHHHVVFTIPHEFQPLWLLNYRVLAKLLFRSARHALFTLAADPRYLGATPGVIMSLHTWGQLLVNHPHIHCIATAGGMNSQGHWVHSRRKHFLPANPLKRLFRAHFIDGVRRLVRRGQLRLPDRMTAGHVLALCSALEGKKWNVWVADRYEHPFAVLAYLGRYVHGGPIGETRLLALEDGRVHFAYKDYRDDSLGKVTSLAVHDFVKRLFQHVPPKSFHVVRGFGLYRRGGSTEDIRRQAAALHPIPEGVRAEVHLRFAPVAPVRNFPTTCPHCQTRVELRKEPRRDRPLQLAA